MQDFSDKRLDSRSAAGVDLVNKLGYLSCMTKVQIGELRDRVSHYVRRAERGETIVIVNRSREVALLSPWRRRPARSARLLGCLKGTASIRGDIVSPIIPADEWFRS
jgi:prevent-host-death family protein